MVAPCPPWFMIRITPNPVRFINEELHTMSIGLLLITLFVILSGAEAFTNAL